MQTVDGPSPAKSVSLSGTDRITKLLWSFRMGRWLGFARNNPKRLGMIRPFPPRKQKSNTCQQKNVKLHFFFKKIPKAYNIAVVGILSYFVWMKHNEKQLLSHNSVWRDSKWPRPSSLVFELSDLGVKQNNLIDFCYTNFWLRCFSSNPEQLLSKKHIVYLMVFNVKLQGLSWPDTWWFVWTHLKSTTSHYRSL